MMPYDAMCITSWVWCARHAGHNRSHVIFQSGPVSWDPSAHEPKLMSSSRWFFLGHQAANGDPFIMFASFLCSQEPTRDGSQSTRKPSCFDEWNQLSLGCHHLWWQWEKTLDVAAGCSWDAGGVSLFRHRIAIAATRSCSVRHWTAGQTDVPHVTVVHGGFP